MKADVLDPLIHVPARLRILATLAALPAGDSLLFTRLQDMIGLTPGNLITHLRKLEDAGYVSTVKTGYGVWSRTTVTLSKRGRDALDAYSAALRELLDPTSNPSLSEARSSAALSVRLDPKAHDSTS
jgi:DNA-binding MarR family transcriptional regulator